MSASRTVVVAGAGLGGLTAALTLAAKGFRVVVLEKAERLDAIGAGIQLSPNASRILIALGLEAKLARVAVVPDAVSLMSARAGGEVARLTLGPAASFRAGAPYWMVHRADLQAALVAQVGEHPDIDLRLGTPFEDVVQHAKGITIGYRNGFNRGQEPALALIGADGIWSAVRHHLFPQLQPQFSGLIAWRGTVDIRQLPREIAAPRVQLWMGKHAHLVAYPVSSGRQINLVAILRGTWNSPGWSAPADAAEIKRAFGKSRWPNAARLLIGAVDDWSKWAMFTLGCSEWARGPVALLGDAAHAMLPFAAQGAAMAIEDAAVLARSLSENTGPPDAALQRYARERMSRTAQIQRLARRNGRIYHLGGAAALARDITIRALGGPRLLARQDWIYDWRARTDFQ